MTTKIDLLRITLVFLAMVLATTSLVQSAKPAEAAFPGNNGNIVFVSDREGDTEIRQMSASLFGNKKLTDNAAEDFAPAVSPNGKKIAFVSDRDGNYEIYLMNRDGSNQTRLTNNPATDAQPAFSPDGSKIVFSSDRDGDVDLNGLLAPEIYVMDAADSDGNGNGDDQARLTNDPGGAYDPSFSPNGNEIAFTSSRDGNEEIYVMGANGADPKNLTNNPAIDSAPDWSPDGKKIAFQSDREGTPQAPNLEIFVMNADGTNPRNLTNNAAPGLRATDSDPAFSPDGTKIAFKSYRDGNSEVYSMNGNGADQKNLSKYPSSGDGEPGWGPYPS